MPIAGPTKPVPPATNVPLAGTYTITLDSKTLTKVKKNAAARKPPMTEAAYLLWLVQGALNTR